MSGHGVKMLTCSGEKVKCRGRKITATRKRKMCVARARARNPLTDTLTIELNVN